MKSKLTYRSVMQIFLLHFIYSICFAQNSDEISETQSSLNTAREIIPEKRYEEALKIPTITIDNNPENYHAYLLRSESKYGLKDYIGSLEDSKAILAEKFKADSNSIFIAYSNIGICYNNLEKYEEALGFLTLAEKFKGSNVKISFSKAYSYLQLQKLDSAYIELDNLLKIDPKDQRGYYGKGRISLMKKNYREAIIEFDKAINISPGYVLAYQNRGEAKRQLGDNAGSCQDWQKCIELGLESMKPYLEMVCK